MLYSYFFKLTLNYQLRHASYRKMEAIWDTLLAFEAILQSQLDKFLFSLDN